MVQRPVAVRTHRCGVPRRVCTTIRESLDVVDLQESEGDRKKRSLTPAGLADPLRAQEHPRSNERIALDHETTAELHARRTHDSIRPGFESRRDELISAPLPLRAIDSRLMCSVSHVGRRGRHPEAPGLLRNISRGYAVLLAEAKEGGVDRRVGTPGTEQP